VDYEYVRSKIGDGRVSGVKQDMITL